MLVCLPAAADEGPGFDPARAKYHVVVHEVPENTFPEFLSTAAMFPELTFGLPSSQWKLLTFGLPSSSLWKL